MSDISRQIRRGENELVIACRQMRARGDALADDDSFGRSAVIIRSDLRAQIGDEGIAIIAGIQGNDGRS